MQGKGGSYTSHCRIHCTSCAVWLLLLVMKSVIKCYLTCDKTKSCFAFFPSMNTVQTHPSNIFQWKTFLEAFFMVEDVWDYSGTVLIKGFSLPPGSLFLQTPSVKRLWSYLADGSMLTRIFAHTWISSCQTHAGRVVGFCSSISQLWWLIWSQSDHTKMLLCH